jgi:hypothetical protein
MICKRPVSLAVATVVGAMLMATTAHARPPHVSRLIVSHRQFVPAFTPISAFYSYGPSDQWGGQFVTPVDGVGVFYEPHLLCWTWVPAGLGWQRVWQCK